MGKKKIRCVWCGVELGGKSRIPYQIWDDAPECNAWLACMKRGEKAPRGAGAQASRRLTELVGVRLTAADLTVARAEAEEQHMTVPALIRGYLLHGLTRAERRRRREMET